MRGTSRKLLPAASALLLARAATACGDDDPAGPEPIERQDVVGSCEATAFRSTVDGETTDHLAAGAELTSQLEADGTTTGRLFVPGGGEDGGDLDESLAGTWTFRDATGEVEFEQDADTLVRDMTFATVRAGGGIRLEAERSFSDQLTIAVALARQ